MFLVIWIVICIVISLFRSMSVYRANCMNLAILFLMIRGSYCIGQAFKSPRIQQGIFCCIYGQFYFVYGVLLYNISEYD